MTEEDKILKEGFENSEELESKKLEQFIDTTKKSYIANLESYRFHKNLLQMLYRDRDARLANHDIMIAKFKPINAHWEFENDLTYQKNLSIIQEGIKQQDVENYKLSEAQVQKTIDVKKEQLDSEKIIMDKYSIEVEGYE